MAPRPLVLAAVLLGAASSGAGATSASDVTPLLRDWTALDGACRGGRGDDPATLAACERRDALHRRLSAAAWCYGRPGDAGYQRVWRSCAGAER